MEREMSKESKTKQKKVNSSLVSEISTKLNTQRRKNENVFITEEALISL